jgi:hypothetical protein
MNTELIRKVRDCLQPWGELRSQPESIWSGEIELPAAIREIYLQIGPFDLSIAAGGNPVQVPYLADLWGRQACYRWHGQTGERLPDWQEQWLAIAFEGSNPFIFDTNTSAVYFDMAGGKPSPKYFARDPITAFGAIATVANTLRAMGDDAYDETFELQKEARIKVTHVLDVFLNGQDDAERMLAAWQWYV